MRTVLITGASGFVGQNFISDFRVSDYNILSPSSTDLDLLNKESVLVYLESNKPDIIINAAGKVGGILRNIKDQYSFLLENTTININLISAAKEKKIKNFINLSSSCIYPNNFDEPIKESDLLTDKLEKTNEGYALAKIIGLKMTDYISNDTDYNYKTIIPCNLFGPNDNFDINFGHMIPSVMHKIHLAKTNNDKMVTIWGDGNSRREFMYIKDLIDFIYYSIENIQKLPNFINVGVGSDYTINEYYKMISKVIGYKGNYKFDLSKPQGMKRKLVDISLLNDLGWKHKYQVEVGLEETYKFYEQNYE
ncbi:GDP-L-fucose synthase [Flavobacteriaceae bacterium]|nr:GDP-L-fucose synthase [Flavobacteriaceae bacterium]